MPGLATEEEINAYVLLEDRVLLRRGTSADAEVRRRQTLTKLKELTTLILLNFKVQKMREKGVNFQDFQCKVVLN